LVRGGLRCEAHVQVGELEAAEVLVRQGHDSGERAGEALRRDGAEAREEGGLDVREQRCDVGGELAVVRDHVAEPALRTKAPPVSVRRPWSEPGRFGPCLYKIAQHQPHQPLERRVQLAAASRLPARSRVLVLLAVCSTAL